MPDDIEVIIDVWRLYWCAVIASLHCMFASSPRRFIDLSMAIANTKSAGIPQKFVNSFKLRRAVHAQTEKADWPDITCELLIPIMPDVLIMNHRPLDPPSPTSSATYIKCSSPGYKAPMINKGKFNEPLYCSRSPTSMSSRLSTGVNHDIPPGNFLAEVEV